MRLALKLAVVLGPIVLVVLLLRACDRESGERWLERARAVDDAAVLALDRAEIITVAPDRALGVEMGEYAVAFKRALVEQYGDLLGEGSDKRMVLLIFSEDAMVQEFAGQGVFVDRKSIQEMMGYTDPGKNAIVLPPRPGMDVLRHEVVHLLMGLETEGRVRHSPWLLEGLAQYFESFEPPAPALLPREQRHSLYRLVRSQFDVVRLLEMQEYAEFIQVEGGRNYRESLALVAYLMEAQPPEKIRRYVRLERDRGGNRTELFQSVFGDPTKLPAAIRDHLSR